MPEQHPRPRQRIDIQGLKQSVDILAVAQKYTSLTQISQQGEGEYAGPCPSCGGNDRFHVRGQRFYCRQCYPRGGDVIDLVGLAQGVSFKEACAILSASFFSERPPEILPPEPVAKEPQLTLLSEAFQESARKTMAATRALLESKNGEAGQAYLQGRGLTPETWQRYGLGYGRMFHPVRRENMESIFIPWYGEDGQAITAIRHRFLDPNFEKHERYSLKPESQPVLFGIQALQKAQTLVLVEGEVNCMSLNQVGLQALSMGSQTNRQNQTVFSWLEPVLPDYEEVLVWLDKPEAGEEVAAQLQQQTAPFRKKIKVLSRDSDANEMLVRGELGFCDEGK